MCYTLCMVWSRGFNLIFCMWRSSCPRDLFKKLFFPSLIHLGTTVTSQPSMIVRIYLLILNSIPLIHISSIMEIIVTFLPVTLLSWKLCLYNKFWNHKMWDLHLCSFLVCFGYSGFLPFLYEFWVQLVRFCKSTG